MSKTLERNDSRLSYRVPALEKGLEVLELLSGISQPLSLTDIADRLGRTKQELFRVMACLNEQGYLIRDLNQGYRMSTKLFELGSKHASTGALIARATPHMETLANELNEPCHLNLVVRNKMLVIARVNCDADVALAVRIGASFKLHERNSGLVALSFLPDEQRLKYWSQCDLPDDQIREYEAESRAIRQAGFRTMASTLNQGVQDTATPILGAEGRLLAVLCVSHILRVGESRDSTTISSAMLRCSQAISSEFGPTMLKTPDVETHAVH
ncbi:Pca regulon regulatory protein [Gimesia aquarii]|uniref:Pca regulon regulatory protein n=1 Tax=Gimesia aquarii TaxID=2527964 RepID=A0A517WQW8_9PLAN|nr:IclR family transcriptional regulator [Gimesia aquarii]QDT96307.1 Pca regulon regulatory protein [Gimesia aquarii]QDU07655.1 Pca regulon regulatory protein [Gimesia aquarii]